MKRRLTSLARLLSMTMPVLMPLRLAFGPTALSSSLDILLEM
jgi:hypothetical protein